MPSTRRGFFQYAAFAAAPASAALQSSLFDAISKLDCIDTHEHFSPEASRVKSATDLFTLASHYLLDDLINAGMPEAARKYLLSHNIPAIERWRTFEPYWKQARLTGYGQALRIAVHDLYGIDEISASTLPAINDAIQRSQRPGFYRDLIRNRSRIRVAIVEPGWRADVARLDQPFFALSRQFDRYIMIRDRKEIAELESATNVSITNLASLQRAVEHNFSEALSLGMVAVKTTLAYHRDLAFHRVTPAQAEADLTLLLTGQRETGRKLARFENRPFRNLEDFMLRHVVTLAQAHKIPVQIHTGTFAGHWNYVANSNPAHLTQLFFDFPDVRFDLFHMSYPYQGELCAITKLFPHVYADFCWAYVLSPAAARRALREFLEAVPANKILAFGGDYWFPELTYAHLVMARRSIAMVLSELIEERICTESEALDTARTILHDAPTALFNLGTVSK